MATTLTKAKAKHSTRIDLDRDITNPSFSYNQVVVMNSSWLFVITILEEQAYVHILLECQETYFKAPTKGSNKKLKFTDAASYSVSGLMFDPLNQFFCSTSTVSTVQQMPNGVLI